MENNPQSIEGFQYILNEIPQESEIEPESFFVCYFDSNAKLKDRGQKEIKKGLEKLLLTIFWEKMLKIRKLKN